jgi:hypothetical protein
VVEIGRRLEDAKRLVGHGQFLCGSPPSSTGRSAPLRTSCASTNCTAKTQTLRI